MPEGDSYTHAARRITPLLVGRRITAVEGSAPSVRRHSAAILDTVVDSVRTRGKHLLIDLASGLSAHVHLGMAGRVRTTPPGKALGADLGAVRLSLATDQGTVWVLGAPTVDIERRWVIDQSLDHLGPDLLASHFDMERFEMLADRYPPDSTLSDFLLDQRVMAGVGNEYKCEVLFLEKLAPQRTVESVDAGVLRRLAGRARVLLQANADRTVRSTTGRPDGSMWVYGRTGRPCRRCRTAVAEDWLGEPPRITYWCPSCQQ